MTGRHLLNRWKAVWQPDMYHGWGRKKNYFEGWYFKLVCPDGDSVFAVIPGISMDSEGNRQAFIQVLDGKEEKAWYYTFEPEDFIPDQRKFHLQIGENSFSPNHLTLNLDVFQGTVRFTGMVPWPATKAAPGIMGWYSFVPFMECYHGVVSMHHSLYGSLIKRDGESCVFDGGAGYIEKDWGTSFPRSWIWMQSNHFANYPEASFMFSLAHIPWLGSYFNGFISGLWLDGKWYRFATYTGAIVKGKVKTDAVDLSVHSGSLTLTIHAAKSGGGTLMSPIKGNMKGKVNESMTSELQLELRENSHLIFEDKGKFAGLEFSGDVNGLLAT